jgi:hypothetical protein
MSKAAEKILKKMKDENIGYVDLRFTDVKGKMQHVTFDASMVDEDLFEDGTMFDGSSIAGWKSINESDMVLLPDPDTAQANLMAVTHVAQRNWPRPISNRPRSVILFILDPKPNSLYLMMSAGIRISKTQAILLTASKALIIPVRSIRAAIRGIVRGLRAVTSLSHQLTQSRICARKCCLSWPNLGLSLRNITTKWPRPSMSW